MEFARIGIAIETRNLFFPEHKHRPIARVSQPGGSETTMGGTFSKCNTGCMQQPGSRHEMGEQRFQMGGGGHHWPPLATVLHKQQLFVSWFAVADFLDTLASLVFFEIRRTNTAFIYFSPQHPFIYFSRQNPIFHGSIYFSRQQ